LLQVLKNEPKLLVKSELFYRPAEGKENVVTPVPLRKPKASIPPEGLQREENCSDNKR
jgi:hypothetical protein